MDELCTLCFSWVSFFSDIHVSVLKIKKPTQAGRVNPLMPIALRWWYFFQACPIQLNTVGYLRWMLKVFVSLLDTLHTLSCRTTSVITCARAMGDVLGEGIPAVCVNFKWMSGCRDFQCIISLLRHDLVGSAVGGANVGPDWQISVSAPGWWA